MVNHLVDVPTDLFQLQLLNPENYDALTDSNYNYHSVVQMH